MQSDGPYPSIQSLRAMLAVARERSFTRAAAELGLTQTAISHQIAQLEAWLGVRLFVRDRSGVDLTEEAVIAVPRIADAMARLQSALESAKSTDKSQKLRISTTSEFATQWLQRRLGRFCSAYPAIDVSVTIEYRRANLDAEKVGVAIWLMGTRPQEEAIQLTDDHEFVVCSPAIASRLPEHQALRAAPLLRYEGARHTVLDWERWYEQLYGCDENRLDHAAHGEHSIFNSGPCYPTFSEMITACMDGAGLALVRTVPDQRH